MNLSKSPLHKIWGWIIAGFGIGTFLIFSGFYYFSTQQKFGGFSNAMQQANPFAVVSPSTGMAATTTRFIGTVSPNVDAQFDLGELLFRWRNLFLSGNATVGGVLTVGSCVGCGGGGGGAGGGPFNNANIRGQITEVTTTDMLLLGGSTTNTAALVFDPNVGSASTTLLFLPATTTLLTANALYNQGGSLFFNGAQVGSGGSGGGGVGWTDSPTTNQLYTTTGTRVVLMGGSTTNTAGFVFNPSTGAVSSTQFDASTGTPNNPSFSFTASPLTGFYSSSTDEIDIAIAGQNKASFSNFGYFQLGGTTTQPRALLSLMGANNVASTTASGGINFGSQSANLYSTGVSQLKTDGSFTANSTLNTTSNNSLFGSGTVGVGGSPTLTVAATNATRQGLVVKNFSGANTFTPEMDWQDINGIIMSQVSASGTFSILTNVAVTGSALTVNGFMALGGNTSTSPTALLTLSGGNGVASTTASGGINFGDANADVYRVLSGKLQMDGALSVLGALTLGANGNIAGPESQGPIVATLTVSPTSPSRNALTVKSRSSSSGNSTSPATLIFADSTNNIMSSFNASGTLALGESGAATTGTELEVVGTASTTGLYVTGASVTMPGLGGISGTADDFVCWDQSGGTIGLLGHQSLNCSVSSARYKEHIQSLSSDDLLAETMKLRSVSFDYREGHYSEDGSDGAGGGGKESKGYIAEEVARIDPTLVGYTSKYTPEDLAFEEKNYPDIILHKGGKTLIPQTVDYMRMSYVLTGAVQAEEIRIEKLESTVLEQQKEIDLLKKQNEALTTRVDGIEHRVGVLEQLWQWIKSLFSKK